MDRRGNFARFDLTMKARLRDGHLSLKLASIVFAVTSLILILTLPFYVRPIQDDYFVINAIGTSSVKKFLRSIWESQGGNLFPYFVNSELLNLTKSNINFIGLTFFCLITMVATSLSGVLIFKMLLGDSFNKIGNVKFLIIPLLVFVTFEGLFVPTLAGAYLFSLASLAHLWPSILMVFSIYLYLNRPNLWPIAIPLGILVGNSNAGESFASLLIFLFISSQHFRKPNNAPLKRRFSVIMSCGLLIGFVFMVTAPGFSNRASNSVGLPSSISDLLHRFIKAAVSFPIDALSHPGAYLALALGYFLCSNSYLDLDIAEFRRNYRNFSVSFFLLLGALIGGGTFAYSSWHQSLGLDLFLAPIFFGLGVLVGSSFPEPTKSVPTIFLILSLCLVSASSTRATYLIQSRANTWDVTLKSNICQIRSKSEAKITGAELRYPPLNLGIEDVQSWEWMRIPYVAWVKRLPEFQATKCD